MSFFPRQFIANQATSCTFVSTGGINTTNGDTAAVGVTCFGNHINATPVSDNLGNTYKAFVPAFGGTQGFAAIFFSNNITGGANHIFTFTANASDNLAIAVLDIAGVVGSIGQSNTNVANVSAHTSGNVTSGTGDELWLGVGSVSSASEGTPSVTGGTGGAGGTVGQSTNANGWITMCQLGGTDGIAAAFKFVPANTTDQFGYSCSVANNEACAVACFRSYNANFVYVNAAKELTNGSLSWTGGNVRARLLSTTAAPSRNDTTMASGYTAFTGSTDQTLTCAQSSDTVNERVNFTAANITCSGVSTSSGNVGWVIVYFDNGGTGVPISAMNFIVQPLGQPININWDATGVFYLQE